MPKVRPAAGSLSDLWNIGYDDRSGPFRTGFLTHSGSMGLQIRHKLASLGPILAIEAHSSTGC